jgi:hypothetical protein
MVGKPRDGRKKALTPAQAQKRYRARKKHTANRFHRGAADGRHYWLTPPELYAALDAEFHFDFDPCPYPLPDGFDGLTCDWGRVNWMNPPFGTISHEGRAKGVTAWVNKALAEQRKGNTTVMVFPLHRWLLKLLVTIGADVRDLGEVKWCAIEDGAPGPGGNHIACFVLRGEPGGNVTESQ